MSALDGFYRSRALAHYLNGDNAQALADTETVLSIEGLSPDLVAGVQDILTELGQ